MNYAKLLEISSFFTCHIFLEVGKTQDMPSKIWQTAGDVQTHTGEAGGQVRGAAGAGQRRRRPTAAGESAR